MLLVWGPGFKITKLGKTPGPWTSLRGSNKGKEDFLGWGDQGKLPKALKEKQGVASERAKVFLMASMEWRWQNRQSTEQ